MKSPLDSNSITQLEDFYQNEGELFCNDKKELSIGLYNNYIGTIKKFRGQTDELSFWKQNIMKESCVDNKEIDSNQYIKSTRLTTLIVHNFNMSKTMLVYQRFASNANFYGIEVLIYLILFLDMYNWVFI